MLINTCLVMHSSVISSDRERSELIAIALFLALAGLDANLLVVFFQRCQILPGLRKLALFHPFSDIPVHKGALRVHQIELMVDAREDLSDRCGVADHAASAHDLGQVATRDHSRWLVVDSAFKAGGTPVNKLNGAFGLDSCH